MASTKMLLKLPQLNENWYVIVRTAEGILDQENQRQPETFSIILVCLPEKQRAFAMDILPAEQVSPKEVLDVVLTAIRKPEKSLRIQPHRPGLIRFEQQELKNELDPAFQELGIQTTLAPVPESLNEMLEALDAMLFGSPFAIDGLLEIPGVSLELARKLFQAAALVYRAAPWKRLANSQLIVVQLQPQFAVEPHPIFEKTTYLSLMGYGGMEYGMIWFQSLEDFYSALNAGSDAVKAISENGWKSLSFEKTKDAPEQDQKAQKKYRWDLAGPAAFPVFNNLYQTGFTRPDSTELDFWEVLLRAVLLFTGELIYLDETDDFEPIEKSYTINGEAGPFEIKLSYLGEQGYMLDGFAGEDDLEEDQDELYLEFFDDKPDPEEVDPAILLAYDRMVRAQHEDDPQVLESLAREALQAWPDCAPAYLLLGDSVAQSAEEAAEYYTQAIQAGERSMGKKFIEDNTGALGHVPAASSYLVARDRLIPALIELDRLDEALEHARLGLLLDDEDQLGFRYSALALLLQLNQNEETLELLEAFEDDPFCAWPYSKALLLFRLEGVSPAADSALKIAIKANHYVPAFLTGRKPLPDTLPDQVEPSGQSEAIFYATTHFINWWTTPGAVDWLKQHDQPGNRHRRRK
jgi:tetratricopeptide (TPR) repeat protein